MADKPTPVDDSKQAAYKDRYEAGLDLSLEWVETPNSSLIWGPSQERNLLQVQEAIEHRKTSLSDKLIEYINRGSGKGSFHTQIQNTMRGIDRFGHRSTSYPSELVGYTFITRPKLNLATVSLKQDPSLILLNSKDADSIGFTTRMLLDSKLSRSSIYSDRVGASALFDVRSPWLTPVMNTMTSLNGFPDPTMEVYTTEGGFFSEDISFAAGAEMGTRTFELQADFNDLRFGVILNLFYFWYIWIANMCKGVVQPYEEDMNHNILPYTVSIYRFLLDPSRTYITRWAKCTGCFPRAVPVGTLFNYSEGEVYTSQSTKFSIPFTCNHFGPYDVNVLVDFNTLALRYCPDLLGNYYFTAPSQNVDLNYVGLPYIVSTQKGPRFIWRYRRDERRADITRQDLDDDIAKLSELDLKKTNAIFKEMSEDNWEPNIAYQGVTDGYGVTRV